MPLSEKNIVVDMIIQNASIEGHTDLTFTVSRKDIREATRIISEVVKDVGAEKMEVDDNVAKVSIIGVGMISPLRCCSEDVRYARKGRINIKMISTSEIKVSCVVGG